MCQCVMTNSHTVSTLRATGDNQKGTPVIALTFFFSESVWKCSKADPKKKASTDMAKLLKTGFNFWNDLASTLLVETLQGLIPDIRSQSLFLFALHTGQWFSSVYTTVYVSVWLWGHSTPLLVPRQACFLEFSFQFPSHIYIYIYIYTHPFTNKHTHTKHLLYYTGSLCSI